LRKKSVFSLPPFLGLSTSLDIIGDIGIIRSLPNTSHSLEKLENFGQSLLHRHKNVKTIFFQSSSVDGTFRLRKLDYILGEKKTQTLHKEHSCVFSVDIENCYFSPRLSHERWRIAQKVMPGEVIVNMFAGVGCFSILIAKKNELVKVYSIDINPIAITFMEKNVRLNRVYNKVTPLLGDAKIILKNKLCGIADRILMPLPEKAYDYLSSAILSLKKSGGWIHYYDFEYGKKNVCVLDKTKFKVSEKLNSLGIAFNIPTSRIIRSIGPNWYQVVLDIHILKVPDSF